MVVFHLVVVAGNNAQCLGQVGFSAVRGAQDTDVKTRIYEIQRSKSLCNSTGQILTLSRINAIGEFLGTATKMCCAQTALDAFVHLLLVLRLHEGGNRHQRIEFQKIRRPVHFVQRGRHTGQSHFVQFSQKGVKKSFSGEHYLSPPFPLD